MPEHDKPEHEPKPESAEPKPEHHDKPAPDKVSAAVDNFLSEAVRPPRHRRGADRALGYIDGFRFGIGFFIANLLMFLILGGLTWVLVLALHLH